MQNVSKGALLALHYCSMHERERNRAISCHGLHGAKSKNIFLSCFYFVVVSTSSSSLFFLFFVFFRFSSFCYKRYRSEQSDLNSRRIQYDRCNRNEWERNLDELSCNPVQSASFACPQRTHNRQTALFQNPNATWFWFLLYNLHRNNLTIRLLCFQLFYLLFERRVMIIHRCLHFVHFIEVTQFLSQFVVLQ